MYCIIMCGGTGTRLWPLSRRNFPKQFLKLYSDKSLLQETYLRMEPILPTQNIFFIAHKEHFYNIYNQIKEIKPHFDRSRIILEPAGRNTGPAILWSIKYLVEKIKIPLDEPIVFLPADHYIKNKKSFTEILTEAVKTVGDNIGTLGVKPDRVDTGYGYIQKGEKEQNYFKVLQFKEKPDIITAEQYLTSGEYLWNAGFYFFNSRAFVHELKLCSPELYQALTQNFETLKNNFNNLPNISIDYALAEKSKKVIVFEGNFGWSDIGSLENVASLEVNLEKNRHINIDSKNILIHSENNKLVATIGVEDLVVIENKDSILIHKKGRGAEVKKVVETLKEKNWREIDDHLEVFRPWGKYEVLIDCPQHKVKKITVYPGEKLSLQKHYHRVEHWIILKGVAKVINGEKEIILKENESSYIEANTLHRLENPGKINLEMIEVQTGNYLEEDDIIRCEDIYERDEN